jgi:hypothetical protein
VLFGLGLVRLKLNELKLTSLCFGKDLNTDATRASEHSQSVATSNTKTSDEDLQLENAASIGTSLMLVNSHRALFIMYVIFS